MFIAKVTQSRTVSFKPNYDYQIDDGSEQL